jgi:hypothetical protein
VDAGAGPDAKRSADAARDAARDATAADAPPGDADADRPPVSPDFACDAPWSSPAATADPRCAGVRTVSLVEATVLTLGGISIARTAAGRIGIAYDDVESTDTAAVHLAAFLAPATSGAALDVEVIRTGVGASVATGLVSSVAAAGAGSPGSPFFDALQLAYVDVTLEELDYQQLVDGGPDLTPTQLVAEGVGAGAYLSLAVGASGAARVAYYVPSLGAVKSAAGGSTGFAAPEEVVTGLDPDPPGVGQVSLLIDADETPNLLFVSGLTSQYSLPEYATFDGAAWSAFKQVEGTGLDGYAGFSPSLAIHGSTKLASYFVVPQEHLPPLTAELHLASFESAADTAAIDVLDPGMPASAADGTTPDFRFQAAVAFDPDGLWHAVVVHPRSSGPATLDYVRQAVVNGATTELTDVVDGDVLGDAGATAPDAFAAITVDPSGRPHIAYRSGRDGNVYYATRFDR